MITELTQDLINKIISVPQFQNRVGAAVGGTENDPTLAKAPLPYSWVIFEGSQPVNAEEGGSKYRLVRYGFTAIVGIAYGVSDQDLLTNQLPIFEAVEQAVSGTEAHKMASLWEYHGVELTKIDPDRMVYRMHFSAIGHFKTT